ncbi:MAG: cation:proton antiporter [Phycisphaerales bacterium]
MKSSLQFLAAALIVVVLAWLGQHVGGSGLTVRPTSEGPALSQQGTGMGIGLLLLGSWFIGMSLKAIGLPKITGFLIFGMLMGPSALALVRKAELEDLRLVNDLAVALIALAAGGAIRFAFLRSAFRTVSAVVTAQVVLVMGIGTLAAVLLLRWSDILPNASNTTMAWMGLVMATIATAGSPAVVIALLNETSAKGRFAQLTLTSVVTKDVMLIILFTIVSGLAIPAVLGAQSPDTAAAGLDSIARELAWTLLGSIGIGVLAGVALAWYVQRSGAYLPIVIALSSFGIALFSRQLGLEALLVALVAGVFMRNLWEASSRPFFEAVDRLSLPVYCVFFAVAGCKVSLPALAELWVWVAMFVGARAIAMVAGTFLGAAIAGERGPTLRWLWSSSISQAGVAVALAGILERTFRSLEGIEDLFTLILATIAVNELTGPILLKLGLARAATEDQTPAPDDPDQQDPERTHATDAQSEQREA